METTKIFEFGNNIVKQREWVRNRRIVRDPKGGPGAAVMKEYLRREYWVFIGCNSDQTTCFGHQTRIFTCKAEAFRYAKSTKPVPREHYEEAV